MNNSLASLNTVEKRLRNSTDLDLIIVLLLNIRRQKNENQ